MNTNMASGFPCPPQQLDDDSIKRIEEHASRLS